MFVLTTGDIFIYIYIYICIYLIIFSYLFYKFFYDLWNTRRRDRLRASSLSSPKIPQAVRSITRSWSILSHKRHDLGSSFLSIRLYPRIYISARPNIFFFFSLQIKKGNATQWRRSSSRDVVRFLRRDQATISNTSFPTLDIRLRITCTETRNISFSTRIIAPCSTV